MHLGSPAIRGFRLWLGRGLIGALVLGGGVVAWAADPEEAPKQKSPETAREQKPEIQLPGSIKATASRITRQPDGSVLLEGNVQVESPGHMLRGERMLVSPDGRVATLGPGPSCILSVQPK